MSIVKMKHLRLFGMASDREALLSRLQHVGCVEVREPADRLSDPDWAGLTRVADTDLARRKGDAVSLEAALSTLNKYTKEKSKLLQLRPVITEEQLFDDGLRDAALAVAGQINEGEKQIAALYSEESKLKSQALSLTPWLELDVALDAPSTEEVSLTFGSLSKRAPLTDLPAELSAVSELCEVVWAGEDQEQRYMLLLCHKSAEAQVLELLKKYGFARSTLRDWHGTARENTEGIHARLRELGEERTRVQAAIAELAPHRGELRLCMDRINQDIQREEAKGRLMESDSVIFLEGWVAAPKLPDLEGALQGFTCAWETADPVEEEYPEVPVQLKNNALTRPLNMVTEMYALPAYDGVDPNPIMAPFFIFFYGFMMADMGYGLLMMLAAYIIMKKTKPKGATMRHMIPLLGLCGVSTFIMGAVTGGFFGDLLPQLAMMLNPNTTFTAMPALFSPLDDALMVLIGSLAIGVVQIFTGMAVSMYRKIKRGEVMAALCGEGAWYVVFLCITLGAVTGQWTYALLAALVVIVLTQGYGKKGLVGKLMGIGGSLYNNITGYFSDILSYSRLMALMLAGAVIAQVFNTLGGITGNVITFFLISMVGNALNFGLNLLGCYVHDMRLQCLEFFSRFYEDGGKPFRPLTVDTQYVDVQPMDI